MNYQVLKTELSGSHPKTGAYNASNALAAAQINAVNVTVTVSTVAGSEILNATDAAEFSALASTSDLRNQWLGLCAVDDVNTTSGVAKFLESQIFGPGTTTRSNLQDLRKDVLSRSTQLELGPVREGDVQYARNLP